MNRFIPSEPVVFRPHSAVRLGDPSYRPMATYRKHDSAWYRAWRAIAQIAVFGLCILAAIAAIQMMQFKLGDAAPACPSYLPEC